MSKLERCEFADSDRWGDPEWGSKTVSAGRDAIAGHWTVGVVHLYVADDVRRRRSQSQEKEGMGMLI